MKNCLLILLSVIAGCSSFAQEYILQGNIGTFPIGMKIDCDQNSCSGTYFYNSSLKDITFEGAHIGPLFMLFKTAFNEKTKSDDTVERFALTQNNNKTWTGAWQDNKGKQFDVSLKEIGRNNKKGVDEYANLRASFYITIKDSTIKKGTYTLEYYHIGKSKVYALRINDGISKTIAGKINTSLEAAAKEQAEEYFSCTSPIGEPDFDYSISSTFLTDNVISVVASVAYYCGGPHPDDYERSVNINVKTGEQLELEDVLYLTSAPRPPKNSDKQLDYRLTEYAPKLVGLLTTLYPKKMVKDTGDYACDYSDETFWQFPDWYFTADGLYIRPLFPHVIAECSDPDWSTVPYDVLKKYKNPAKNISLP